MIIGQGGRREKVGVKEEKVVDRSEEIKNKGGNTVGFKGTPPEL